MTGARRLVKPTAATPAEKIREFEQRVRQLETKQTLRIGEWVLTTHPSTGDPVLIKPGVVKALDGTDISLEPEVVDLAMRGFVTKSDAALAVSGGATKSLSVATSTQVQKDVATAGAQYTADNALAQAAQALALLEAGVGGEAYNDSFDRDEADNSLGPDYDAFVSSGANMYGTRGDGTTGHTRGLTGATLQSWMFRRKDALTSAQQRVSATWVKKPRSGQTSGNNAQLRLFARTDASDPLVLGARVQAFIENDRVRIGYYTSDLESSWVPLTDGGDSAGWKSSGTADGDSFDFWVGLGATGHDRFRFALLRNNLTVATADDLPENTTALLANRHGGMGVRNAVIVITWLTQTAEAPSLQALNIADRTAPA